MFDRFTDGARRVVVLAQEEARLLLHDYIGTEHLLLGLLHEGEGGAAQALESAGLSLEAGRALVGEIVGEGAAAPSGHIPFTPRAKKVLELALRESLQLSHSFISTEHLLLGVIREGKGVATQMLVRLGVDLAQLRQRLVDALADSQENRGRTGERSGPTPSAQTPVVDSLLAEVESLRRQVDSLREALRQYEEPATKVESETVDVHAVGVPSAEPLVACSFCSQPQDQVVKLVTGPGVAICNECIDLCQEILAQEGGSGTRDADDPPSS